MIVLVGFMAAGKSTVGRLLAAELSLPFMDTDDLVEARAGKRVASIFEEDGEAVFRALEREVVAEVLHGPEAVVALGGGALGDRATEQALRWATVVHLDVSFDEAMRRIAAAGGREASGRPMLSRADPSTLHALRDQTYRDAADVSVPTDGLSPEAVAGRILSLLTAGGAARGRARRVTVPLGARSYDIAIGAGLAHRGADFLPELPDAERAFILTHPRLEPLTSDFAGSLAERGLSVETATVSEGETSKSLAAAAQLYERLAEWGAHRNDVIVAFGGGVICDLAGFVASTLNRGMPLVHVATSLLAQVDAAIGGKTGVNLPHGKNLVGTFYQPAAVICDVELLRSLPDEEMRSGMAEVIKYGLIADHVLLETVEERWADIAAREEGLLTEVVARSAAIKAGIVGADERESGERAHLNYGHTFGHAIEQVYGYRGIRHGEAISLGMVAAAYLAEELGWLDDADVKAHRRALEAVGLPTHAPLDFEALETAWVRDKKYLHGVRFVLLEALGRPRASVKAPRDLVRRAIERLAA